MFESKKALKSDINVNHSRDIKCKDCGSIFNEQWKFEEHLTKDHGKAKTFDCENCDESLFTNWRLTLSDMGALVPLWNGGGVNLTHTF